jgi:hypothetical protein
MSTSLGTATFGEFKEADIEYINIWNGDSRSSCPWAYGE